MKQIAPFIALIAVAIVLAVVVISLLNYILKKKIIESGPLDDNSLNFLRSLSDTASSTLKWALLLFFGGLGLMVLEFVPYSAEHSPVPFGIEAIFLSLGFFIYYVTGQKVKK